MFKAYLEHVWDTLSNVFGKCLGFVFEHVLDITTCLEHVFTWEHEEAFNDPIPLRDPLNPTINSGRPWTGRGVKNTVSGMICGGN